MTKNNEEALTENNHILENNNKFNLNRRNKFLKNGKTDKEKGVSNIRLDCALSPETSSPKLSTEIVGDLIINGITHVDLSSKCKYKFQIKPYGGQISEDFVNNIRLTLRRKPVVIAIHLGTNGITNDDCSSLQINITKSVVSYRTISINEYRRTLRHDKSNINVKINRRNEIIQQFCKTNKLDLINNSNIKDKKLYCKKNLI